MTDRRKLEADIAAMSAAESHVDDVRSMTLAERGELLARVCEASMLLERAKLANGLPATLPAPWPESTWQFLRKHAPNARAVTAQRD